MSNELKNKRILFFTPGEDVRIGGVFASQVTGLARYCVRLGAETLIYHRTAGDVQDCEEFEPGIRLLSVNHDHIPANLFNIVQVCRDEGRPYWQRMVDFKPTHIYVRTYIHCIVARELADQTGAKLIYSMRGPDAYETRKHGGLGNLIRSFFVERGVKKAMKLCDGFTSMSNAAIEWCERKYGVRGQMIPCCVTESFFSPLSFERRKEIRSRFGFSDEDKVIVWSGSPAYWQCLDRIVELLKELSLRDPKIKILFMAYHMEKYMEELCASHSFDCRFWRVVSLSQSEVADHLKSCDVGIDVLATDDFKSSICCPVKVGEYLACGLPVLISRTMGDVPELVRRYSAGEIMDDSLSIEDTITKFREILNVSPMNARCCAQEFFSWESQDKAVRELFK